MGIHPPADHLERIEEAARAVRERSSATPRIALVLGSGLGAFADTLEGADRIDYRDIPHWPASTVEGHSGRLVIGRRGDAVLAVMQGRVHLYEGYSPWQVVFPLRVLERLGCRSLLVTNAAGAINRNFAAGDLMLISDHINLQGTNACIGDNLDALGPRFFDMTYAYDGAYRNLARRAAARRGLELREGVYVAVLGPSYETPAEIRMLADMGADAVGMSTVPEVVAANHMGMRVVGISCLSNMAAGVLDQPLDHREVMQTGARVREAFIGLVEELVAEIAAAAP
ncbi:MAG: purine-nucleoside phosphorylase [Acidobacteriota bacterium]|jgi:purine-nucleoside phosphorylase